MSRLGNVLPKLPKLVGIPTTCMDSGFISLGEFLVVFPRGANGQETPWWRAPWWEGAPPPSSLAQEWAWREGSSPPSRQGPRPRERWRDHGVKQ